MASLTTRALLLGVVCIFEPVNGYQLRRELLSWDVEDWAHIKPGSIYSMLTTFVKQGLLVRHDLPDGDRTVAVYTMSAEGRDELQLILREALVTVNAMEPSAFRAAISLSPLLQRRDLLDALGDRLRNAQEEGAVLRARIAALRSRRSVPSHVAYSLELELGLVETERMWVENYIDAVSNGSFSFAGEPMNDWEPAPDDGGWQMVEETRRYRELIEAEKS
jgi:DNA-binding PadR family transcriptional regulator